MHPHLLIAQAVPRLLAVSFGTALLAAIAIRLKFRRYRSHMSYRSPTRGAHRSHRG